MGTGANNMFRSRSLLLLIAALASTLVAAEAADWKRGLDAIVTKLQTKDDATAPVEDANTIVPENPDPSKLAEASNKQFKLFQMVPNARRKARRKWNRTDKRSSSQKQITRWPRSKLKKQPRLTSTLVYIS